MSEVVLKRRAPLDVVRYVLQKLEKEAVATGSFPVLVHVGLEAEEKVRTEVEALREENARLRAEVKRVNDALDQVRDLANEIARLEELILEAEADIKAMGFEVHPAVLMRLDRLIRRIRARGGEGEAAMKTDYEKFRDSSPENAALLDAEARVLAAEEACAALREENARLREQLPEGMKHCTILFRECEKGHGRLTATNWVDRGCPFCERDEARAVAVAGDVKIGAFRLVKDLRERVQELEREQGTLVKLGQFVGDKLDGAWRERAEAAEAKLARCVEALEQVMEREEHAVKHAYTTCDVGSDTNADRGCWWCKARAALAAAKGE